MFKLKFTLLVIIILVISMLLFVYISVFKSSETDVDNYELGDEGTVLIMDDNGEIHEEKVTHTYKEGSASAPAD